MADKKVNLIISLKDNVSAGLTSVRNGLVGLRSGFADLAKAAAVGSAAIVAGLGAVLKAYAGQETANAKLKATFNALGESGTLALAKFGAFASEIQRTTTVGDETTLGLVTLAKTMGIANDQIKGAVQGAIGLSKAFGLDLNSALKMTALAMNGQYEMLGRYIPALRTANTEAEKQAIVQQAMATGFAVAKDEIKTIAGSWEAFKSAFGESLELFGEAIFGEGGFVTGITNLRIKLQELADDGSITKWGETTKTVLGGIGTIIGKIVDGWGMLLRAFQKGTTFIGALAGNIVSPKRDAGSMLDIIKDAAEQTQRDTKPILAQKTESKRVADLLRKKVPSSQGGSGGIADIFGGGGSSGAGGSSITGGFGALYMKWRAQGVNEQMAQDRIRATAEQEKLGKTFGVSGAGMYGASLQGSGLDSNQIMERVRGMVGANKAGETIAGGALSNPAEQTNKLLETTNSILSERLGGVSGGGGNSAAGGAAPAAGGK
jgi:hypothetical protein